MPSLHLFDSFDRHLTIQRRWQMDGRHYRRTCEAWLGNLDAGQARLVRLFERRAGLTAREARIAVQRWRIFFMACAELFNYGGGDEWFVAHYLLQPRGAAHDGSTGASLPGQQLDGPQSRSPRDIP